jgi:LmbE family N-acetylglucosaminyl deacetylase
LHELGRGDRVLVIHAHPDDETLATGATVAELAGRGAEVVLATATSGEAAERVADDDPATALATARQRREHRLLRACELLGIRDHHRLGGTGHWVDAGRDGGPDSLSQACEDELVGALVELLKVLRPAVVLTVGADGITNHPDHVMISRTVSAALDRIGEAAPPAFGACVHERDVADARALLAALLPGTPVGSGGIRGVPDGTADITMRCSPAAAGAKRRALGEYAPGLGTAALDELVQEYRPRGDTLFLRVVFDIAGWGTEFFQRLGNS